MTYCTNCIHYKVCENEGVDDSAMTYCKDKTEKADGDLISRIEKLHTIESTDGQKYYQAYDVLRTIKEYMETAEPTNADGDLISRVKDIIRNDTHLSEAQVIDLLRKIDELPKEPKTAEWIKNGSYYQCSKCLEWGIVDEEHCNIRSKYCPNCGAKMKGESE